MARRPLRRGHACPPPQFGVSSCDHQGPETHRPRVKAWQWWRGPAAPSVSRGSPPMPQTEQAATTHHSSGEPICPREAAGALHAGSPRLWLCSAHTLHLGCQPPRASWGLAPPRSTPRALPSRSGETPGHVPRPPLPPLSPLPEKSEPNTPLGKQTPDICFQMQISGSRPFLPLNLTPEQSQ